MLQYDLSFIAADYEPPCLCRSNLFMRLGRMQPCEKFYESFDGGVTQVFFVQVVLQVFA